LRKCEVFFHAQGQSTIQERGHITDRTDDKRCFLIASHVSILLTGLTSFRDVFYSSAMFTAQANSFVLPLITGLLPAMLLLRLAH